MHLKCCVLFTLFLRYLQRTPDRTGKQEGASAQSREKREVIGRLRDVLQSCHTLLEKTSQVPINGDVSLLQHILK